MSETKVSVTVTIGEISKTLSVDVENNSAKLLQETFSTNMFTESIPTLARQLKHQLEVDEDVVNLLSGLEVSKEENEKVGVDELKEIIDHVIDANPSDSKQFVEMVTTIVGYEIDYDILMPMINYAIATRV
jgi:hypothetical protein